MILVIHQKFDEIGSIEDLQCSVCPATVLTEEKLEEIEDMITISPNLSIRHIGEPAKNFQGEAIAP